MEDYERDGNSSGSNYNNNNNPRYYNGDKVYFNPRNPEGYNYRNNHNNRTYVPVNRPEEPPFQQPRFRMPNPNFRRPFNNPYNEYHHHNNHQNNHQNNNQNNYRNNYNGNNSDYRPNNQNYQNFQPRGRFVKRFHCYRCTANFTGTHPLHEHIVNAHPQSLMTKDKSEEQELRFDCEYCPRAFVLPRDLEKHVDYYHYKEEPFKCDFCYRRFTKERYLQSHIGHIHKEQTREGKNSKKDKTDKKCKKHEKYDRGSNSSSDSESDSDSSGDERSRKQSKDEAKEFSIVCGICRQNFSHSEDYEEHYSSVHKKSRDDWDEETKKFISKC